MVSMSIPIKFDVAGVEKVKTLIELLQKYRSELPSDLLKSLEELCDSSECEFGIDEYENYGGTIEGLETNFHTNKIVSVNKILRRVTFLDDDGYISESYPENFALGCNDKTFIKW